MNDNINNQKILIGKVLKEIRHSLGLTQEEVSEALGLAPRYISDLERDKTKGSLDTLVKLCNFYHITPTYVLKDFLNSPELEIDESLIGFYNLTEDEKDIIRQLICFMNKKKSYNNSNKNIKKSKKK